MTLNLFTSLWLSTTAKQNELISYRLRIQVCKQLCKASITILITTLVTLGDGWGGWGHWWGRRVRQFLVWSLINALTHTFVCSAHAESIGVGLLIHASVKQRITITAAVEGLLADVFFLGFVLFFWRQIDGGCITTQYWEILVAQIIVLVLKKKDTRISI